jgi:hypothetical protein
MAKNGNKQCNWASALLAKLFGQFAVLRNFAADRPIGASDLLAFAALAAFRREAGTSFGGRGIRSKE